ncbi:Imm48 family immunity protein [Macrococcus capreoli]|uniref:Imm48 family immunity protein n=1 Tax=Macrococcus capreoli TaxID=2982690 RepID=UPI0021D56AEB|nr:Imm48 family immunity protein [Macrococcus sp. TMW 2.2395]MCU7558514.1 Imm48 family immunity protein [Macrococcus sp. TMW 2.2395]
MNELKTMYQYAVNVTESLQSSEIYDEHSDADDQAMVAYTFGVLNGYAQKHHLGAEEIHAVMVRLISEHIGYPVDYSESLIQFMISCTNKEVNESIYIIIHKGLDQYLEEGTTVDFQNEYTMILNDIKAVIEPEQAPKRINMAARINPNK